MIDLIDYTPEAARADWLAQRRTVIGSSDIAALAGLNDYATALDVYLDKIEGRETPETQAMKMGRMLEPVILSLAADELGMAIEPNATLVRHPDVPYFGCTPDGIVYIRDERGDALGIVEAKSTARDVDDPTHAHVTQLMWQMAITGARYGWLAYLVRGRDFRLFPIERDEELIATLYEIGHDFYERHLKPQIPPAPHSAADVVKLHPRHTDGKAIEAAPEVAEMIETLRALDADAKVLDARREELKGWIQAAMGDAESLTIGGNAAVTWKASKDSTALDTKRLAAEHPEIVAAYQITKPGSRRFLLK